MARTWTQVGTRLLPFADAATAELPLLRLLRLSLFQVSVGMAIVLLNGTLNRVMIVELGVGASLVAAMISLPVLFAPFRVLVGYRSDTHRSALGWKRVPYIWMGSMAQFGGLAIMPFALILLSGDTHGPAWVGQAGAALAFLLTGIGLHTTQTAGLALATDLAPPAARPRVVALLYVTLLLGMMLSALVFSVLLQEFSQLRLIKVVQGAAMVTMLLNIVALWKQESRDPSRTSDTQPREPLMRVWHDFVGTGRSKRFLLALGLGTAAFSMQDILLEPYGGQILRLAVGATTLLTAILAAGTLSAFAVAARALGRGSDPFRMSALGALLGVFAFAAVIFAAPMDSLLVFGIGTVLIGFGGGLFAVGTLTAAMGMEDKGRFGLALGAWGAVQACTAGGGIFMGGVIRDLCSKLAASGALGTALSTPSTGYTVVYHIEIALLFAALIVIGPLVNSKGSKLQETPGRFGVAEFPG
ncbi:MAG: BCD family MFS transporter [Pseudohongiellaceae bacterium]